MTFEKSLSTRIKRLEKQGVQFTDAEIEDIKTKLLAGICPICRKKRQPAQLCIDHSHAKKAYRGIICKRCNYLLGVVHDNAELLESMSKYLTNTL